MRVGVGDVSDIVAARLKPERKRKFPEKPLARAGGQRCVENLAVFSVRPVEADRYVVAPVPRVLTVVVKRVVVGPAIVSLPGVVGALVDEVGFAIVAHDEDD